MSATREPPARVAILGIKALPAFAGADRVVEQLLESFSPAHSYSVYLIRDGPPAMTCTADRQYVYVPALRGKYLRAPSYFLLCCAHYLLKGRYDVAHVHNSDFGLFCPLLRLKPRVRIVGTFHGDPAKRAKWNRLAKVLLRASETVFVRACHALTSVSPEKLVSDRPVHYIPNGLEARTEPVTESRSLEALGLPEGRYVMFACGRLDRTKGLHHLLAAYRAVEIDQRLLVIGDFSHDTRYSEEIERLAAEDERVLLHRRLLDRAGLAYALSRCSLFVFPSEVEGMSMMLLEAIASGAPVLASDIGANLAVLDGQYPHVFASGDSTALASALPDALRLRRDAPQLTRLREHVAATFRWDAIARAYEQVYHGETASLSA